jgi:hypothetical protein
MNVLNLDRGKGKSTYCVQRSAATQIPILCARQSNKERLKTIARELNLQIPEPATLAELETTALYSEVILDEGLDLLRMLLKLKGVNSIDSVTLSMNDNPAKF